MKTSNIIKFFALPVATSLVLAACGGSGDSKNKLRGRLSFKVSDINWVYPSDVNFENISLSPTIRFQVDTESEYCSRPEDINEVIGIRRFDDRGYELNSQNQIQLAGGVIASGFQPADGKTCEIQVKLARENSGDILRPNTEYVLGVIGNGSNGNTILQANSVVFKTGAQSPLMDFSTLSFEPELWEELPNLNPVTGFNNFGDEDFDWSGSFTDYFQLNFDALSGYVTGVTGLGALATDSEFLLEFNEPIDPVSLRNSITVVKFELNNSSGDFDLTFFESADLRDCANPYSQNDPRYSQYHSSGPCIYYNPNGGNDSIIVKGPLNGCFEPNKTYGILVSEYLRGVLGSRLPSSYARFFRTNNFACN